MGADTAYEMLHPFHLWAQISALCAFILAIAAWALLTLARITSLVAGVELLCPMSGDRGLRRALAYGGV
jgi:hypothetical protein